MRVFNAVHDGSCNYDDQSLSPRCVAACCSGPVWVTFPVSFSSLPLALLDSLDIDSGHHVVPGLRLLLAPGRSGAKSVSALQPPGTAIGLQLGM